MPLLMDPNKLALAGNLLQGAGILGPLGGALQSYGTGVAQQRQAEQQQLLESAKFSMEMRKALAELQAQEEQKQAIQAYGQTLADKPDQLAIFNADPNGYIKQQIAGSLTQDQAADNARLDEQLAFDRQKAQQQQANWEAEQAQKRADSQAARAKAEAEAGQLAPDLRKFYVGHVEDLNKDFNEAAVRYDSASKSLAAGTATGDKAALVHIARLISNEALNEADVARGVSEGVLPSWFGNTWRNLVGKGELAPQQRADLQAQLDREVSARYDAYNQGRGYIAQTIPPQIREDEFQRVLGQTIPDPVAARVKGAQQAQQTASAAPAAPQAAAPAGVAQYEIVDGKLVPVR